MTGQLALDLFPDVDLQPTIAIGNGTSTVDQCGHCGTLVCRPGSPAAQTASPMGPCPACRHDAGWSRQPLGVGPFKPAGPVRAWSLWRMKADVARNGRERAVFRVMFVFDGGIIYRCEHSASVDHTPEQLAESRSFTQDVDWWLEQHEQITEDDLQAIRARGGKRAA